MPRSLAPLALSAVLVLGCSEKQEERAVAKPPPDPKDTSELLAAVREYAGGDCPAAKARLERCTACETPEQRPHRDLLFAWCAEGESPETARALYEAIVIAYPATEIAESAMLRLRQLESPAAPALTAGAPVPASRPGAVYPRLAEAAGVEGRVELGFDVGDDGRVSNARVLESTPAHLFDRAALLAVSRWRYQPGAGGSLRVVLRFELPDAPPPAPAAS
jgi:TonB family protein